MMNQDTARHLQKVGEAFRLQGPFFSYEEICQGNVNVTYKVNYIRDDGTGMARIKAVLMVRYIAIMPVQLRRCCEEKFISANTRYLSIKPTQPLLFGFVL